MYTVIQITVYKIFIFSFIHKVFCRFFLNEKEQKAYKKERKKILLLELLKITLYDV
jgi:hypothetical protein